jgi:hydrogenase-4 component B
VSPVSDPILLFLTIDVVALLLLGTFVTLMSPMLCGFLAAGLSGMGALLCLPPLLFRLPATALILPVGPPGLSLHLSLDPLATVFLLTSFLAGTGVAAFQATTMPLTKPASLQVTIFCLGGTAFALMAADGVSLALGLTMACATIRKNPVWLSAPLLVLLAVCLLTPPGFSPRFDTIRAAPFDQGHTTAAAVLTLMAVAVLVWPRSGERCWTRDALTAGIVLPFATYLLLRLVADLSGAAVQAWWGAVLMLAGGAVAVLQAWRAAEHMDIDTSVAALIRRQAGLTIAGIGLTFIARAADLPGTASFALNGVFLISIGGSLAGTLASLAAHAIGISAGTYRLSRLGGLVHLMPGTSAALAAGLLSLSALPPGLGFAGLWLLFQAILNAPRTGGLLVHLPLALIAASLVVSAALATAATVRLIGVGILGRPRSPRGSGAQESTSPVRTILLTLAGLSLLPGILPGPVLSLLADPAIRALTGAPASQFAFLSISGTSPSYLALPVLALVALATVATMLASRRPLPEAKFGGIWADGMPAPLGLPFGEPAAQSTGAGFLPALPAVPFALLLSRVPAALRISPVLWFRQPNTANTGTKPHRVATARPPSAIAGLWFILATFAALLVALAVAG